MQVKLTGESRAPGETKKAELSIYGLIHQSCHGHNNHHQSCCREDCNICRNPIFPAFAISLSSPVEHHSAGISPAFPFIHIFSSPSNTGCNSNIHTYTHTHTSQKNQKNHRDYPHYSGPDSPDSSRNHPMTTPYSCYRHHLCLSLLYHRLDPHLLPHHDSSSSPSRWQLESPVSHLHDHDPQDTCRHLPRSSDRWDTRASLRSRARDIHCHKSCPFGILCYWRGRCTCIPLSGFPGGLLLSRMVKVVAMQGKIHSVVLASDGVGRDLNNINMAC